jgi:hypothetical protein
MSKTEEEWIADIFLESDSEVVDVLSWFVEGEIDLPQVTWQ